MPEAPCSGRCPPSTPCRFLVASGASPTIQYDAAGILKLCYTGYFGNCGGGFDSCGRGFALRAPGFGPHRSGLPFRPLLVENSPPRPAHLVSGAHAYSAESALVRLAARAALAPRARAFELPCTHEDTLSETAAEFLLSGDNLTAGSLLYRAHSFGFDGVAVQAHEGTGRRRR